MTTPWIQTHTGKAFDLLDPKPDQIDVEDIAHALAHLCRFTGHARRFCSVAQHSCFVAEIAAEFWQAEHGTPCPARVALAALLHDAPEAYIGDVSSPLKIALRGEGTISEYDQIEARICEAIYERFGMYTIRAGAVNVPGLIKRADLIALATEHRDLFDGPPPRSWGVMLPEPCASRMVVPWPVAQARAEFLRWFGKLGGVR